MRIAILLVEPSTFCTQSEMPHATDIHGSSTFDDLCDFLYASVRSLLVGSQRILARYGTARRIRSCAFRVDVVRQDSKHFARMLGREVVPELIDALLRRLFLHPKAGPCRHWIFVDHAVSSGLWSGDVYHVDLRDLRVHLSEFRPAKCA